MSQRSRVGTGADGVRAVLVATALELFGERRYDEVTLGEIAERAGVDRAEVDALFETKADLFTEVARAVLVEIREVTEPDLSLAPEQQLRAAMQHYFGWVQDHEAAYVALYRGSESSEPAVRALVADSLDRQTDRLLGMLAPTVAARPMVLVVVRGWFDLLVASCLRWLPVRDVELEAMSDVLVDMLFAGVASATRTMADEW